MIFHIPGAPAKMAVERFRDGCLKVLASDRRARQPLEQNLSFIEKTRSAIAALKREMLDESLLEDGQLAVLFVPLDGTHLFAVEVHRRHDTGRTGVARSVRPIYDHRAAQTLGGAAAELGAGHPQIFAQEIVHCQVVAHVDGSVRMVVDGHCKVRHASALFSISWVTGSDRKRCPVASKMAFNSAGTTGIITTSATPFGGSFGASGGRISISRSCSGKSEARATTYRPRFHCPLPGPSSNGGSVSRRA